MLARPLGLVRLLHEVPNLPRGVVGKGVKGLRVDRKDANGCVARAKGDIISGTSRAN